jgi:chorismate mutase
MRAIRGATQAGANAREPILEATAELVGAILARNELLVDDVLSVIFTTTPDLNAEFPAVAARRMGFEDVPLLCASEIDVPGALPRVIRLLAYADIDRPRHLVRHVYLRGAAQLRQDLAR